MSDIDFQNGFIAGMASKGLIRSGELYKPKIRNDEGIYSYFYIDFRRQLEDFSLGMLTESLIVYDSVAIPITAYEWVSPGVYRIYADISGRLWGVTVVNKKTSLLSFATGERIPAFSTSFFVAGLDSYERMKYLYEDVNLSDVWASPIRDVDEDADVDLPGAFDIPEVSEISAIIYGDMDFVTASEITATVVLT